LQVSRLLSPCLHHVGDRVHDHDRDEDMEIITLTLEDDTELDCAVMGIFEVEDKEYIALLPLTDDEEDEVLLYRYIEDEENDEFELSLIEEEEEFNIVAEAFYALFSDDEDLD
ncbi:DUF1292 domain-containing protein, partial [Vibrio parahaemolyticus]|nr:DUF1292 domain-containing protein [Vibrio parahaemolyticus]